MYLFATESQKPVFLKRLSTSKTILFERVFLTPRRKVIFGPRAQNVSFLALALGLYLFVSPTDAKKWEFSPTEVSVNRYYISLDSLKLSMIRTIHVGVFIKQVNSSNFNILTRKIVKVHRDRIFRPQHREEFLV